MATGLDEEPIHLLVYCPDEGGWHVGEWLRAGYYKGVWERQGWRTTADHDIELRPTHWLHLPEEPTPDRTVRSRTELHLIPGRE